MPSSVYCDKREIFVTQTYSCSPSRFENLVPSSNFIQVYIKNDYNRNENKSIENLETDGRTIPSQKNSHHEKYFFDSQFFLNNSDDFQLYLNNVCNEGDNPVCLDHINLMVNLENDNNNIYSSFN